MSDRQFRIVTNGVQYRIEQLVEVGWFRKRKEWQRWSGWLGYDLYPNDFRTQQDAQRIVNYLMLEHEWTEVKE